MDAIKNHLQSREIGFVETAEGDLLFQRKDGQGMFVRSYQDGTYDWSVNEARNKTNLMDFRAPSKRSLNETLRRVDEFWDGKLPGRLVIDTLGIVQGAMALGLSREQAERAATAAGKLASDMHNAGLDAGEIRERFAGIEGQLRHGSETHSLTRLVE